MKSVYVNPSYVQSTEGQKGIANLKRRADLDNKGKQYDAPFNLDRGSVLYNWAEWSLQGNDAFIAGGACERKAIQVLIPSTRYKDISTDVIWDAKQARPTVLGHELAFANLIGEYERKKPVDPREPLTLTPKNKEDTEEITPEKLSSAMDIIASITSEGELRALLESFDSPESNPQAPPVVLHIDTSKKEDN
ncbi:hypothetical protein [Nitrosomonas sp. Nm84]|uniref:hypothetical protein n=1 Tax=Nitrosomonas sp. Nm84 TaxID=200124 RepID=UPI00104806EC|nr:hypothetical protein [Nitrosomonas sp. Nm84]